MVTSSEGNVCTHRYYVFAFRRQLSSLAAELVVQPRSDLVNHTVSRLGVFPTQAASELNVYEYCALSGVLEYRESRP